MGLREASDVHTLLGQVGADTDVGRPRNITAVVIFDDNRVGSLQESGQKFHPRGGHRETRGIVGARLKEDGYRSMGERSGQRLRHHPFIVHINAKRFKSQLLEEVQNWRKAWIFYRNAVTEAGDTTDHSIEGIHCAIDNGHHIRIKRPPSSKEVLKRWKDRIFEIARREISSADPLQRSSWVGQKVWVGNASGPRGPRQRCC